MATRMIRKQVYLAPEQDRKLKALAARRGCTEAAVIRDALDRLPDPEPGVEDQLAAAGLLVAKADDPEAPRGAAVRALEAEVEAWLAGFNSRPGWASQKPSWRIAPAARDLKPRPGGSPTYDALVAATARAAGAVLLSCDRRAAHTYERVGAEFRILNP